jgi:multicomponent K+:H+ antiporter subunit A
MLALNFLPKTSKADTSAVRWRDATLAGLAGVGVAWIVYQVLQRPFDSIAPYFLQTTLAEGGGANAVNVIIVDYRGFDTLGEIAVLGMAGLIVALLLRDFRLPNAPSDGQFGAKTPGNARVSLLLSTVTSLLMPIALMVSIYFYLRGHNQPGGGFIAGLVFAIALILQYVAVGQQTAEAQARLHYPTWIGWGLLFAGVTGIGSALVGFPFLTSAFKYFSFPVIGAVPVASAMFFDLGVFLAVIGGTMLALATLGRLGQYGTGHVNDSVKTGAA